jgi:hypothetical protein
MAKEYAEVDLHGVIGHMDDRLYNLRLAPRYFASSDDRKKGKGRAGLSPRIRGTNVKYRIWP